MRRSRLQAALVRVALAAVVAVASLPPTFGALAAAGGVVVADVCSAARGRAQDGAIPRGGEPALPASSRGGHCPLCIVSPDSPAPPIGDAGGLTVGCAAYRLPLQALPLRARVADSHPSAQPRGPPAHA